MTQFKRKASGPLGPEGYRAAARKLRRFAETLDSRADGPERLNCTERKRR